MVSVTRSSNRKLAEEGGGMVKRETVESTTGEKRENKRGPSSNEVESATEDTNKPIKAKPVKRAKVESDTSSIITIPVNGDQKANSSSTVIKPTTKTPPHAVDSSTGKRYWLIKSEPLSRIEGKEQDVAYPLSRLLTDPFTTWDGVRNHEAKNHMLNMARGDYCLFYHSNTPRPGIVGIVEVCKEAHPDHSQWEAGNKYADAKSSRESPRWWCVDVKFKRRLKSKLTLDVLRADPALADMVLVKRGRLSVTPVKTDEFRRILQMEKESPVVDDLDCVIPRSLIEVDL